MNIYNPNQNTMGATERLSAVGIDPSSASLTAANGRGISDDKWNRVFGNKDPTCRICGKGWVSRHVIKADNTCEHD